MRKPFILIILLSINFLIFCQNNLVDEVFLEIKTLKLNQAQKKSQKLSKPIKFILSHKLNFLIYGLKNKDSSIISFYNVKQQIISNIYYGDLLVEDLNAKDTLAYKKYVEALQLANQENLIIYKNACYERLCNLLMKNNYSNKILKKYLNKFRKTANDDIDRFWVEYYDLSYKILKEKKLIISDFNLAFSFAKNNFLKATILQLRGIYFNNYTNNSKIAEEDYEKAINYLKQYNYYITNRQIEKIKFNIGIIKFKKKKYLKAIQIFNRIDKSNKQNKLFAYHWLHQCYASLQNKDSAYYYYLKFNELKDQIDKKGNAKTIVEIQSDEIINKKNQNISTLNSKINTILPILATITILLTIVFILYKKHHKKSKTLEEEKSETIKKIDELKQIVIKNHIVLKDKTKVYIADLLYIKSDDHYLKVYLSNGKNHFVRGRLNKIVEELPPNFIRCHRSYVVNRNFIKQINNNSIILTDQTEIPLSRTFKNLL